MATGYRSYRGRGSSGRIIFSVLIILLLCAAGLFVFSTFFAGDDTPPDEDIVAFTPSPPPTPTLIIEHSEAPPSESPSESPAAQRVKRPRDSDIIVNEMDPLDPQAREDAFVRYETAFNVAELILKNDNGNLGFVSQSEWAVGAEANPEEDFGIADFIDRLHEQNIYVVAQVDTFQENLVSNVYRDMATSTANGVRWLDWRYHGWLNPYNEDAQNYIKELCAEVAQLGVDEVQLRGFRFPTRGRPELLYFKEEAVDGVARNDLLAQLAAEIDEILDGYGVALVFVYEAEEIENPSYISGISDIVTEFEINTQ